MPSPVAHRETLVDFKVTALGDNPPDPRPHSVFPTSARTVLVSANEAAVSHRICQAMTNEEIAGDLGMSPHTVKTHVRNVLRKAECRDRVALVVAIYSGKVALTQEER
jgi:DNA-binding CsgD family transcriptional regulator